MNTKKQSDDVGAGMRIELPKKGGVFGWLKKRLPLAQLVNAVNALLGIEVHVPFDLGGQVVWRKARVEIARNGMIIRLPAASELALPVGIVVPENMFPFKIYNITNATDPANTSRTYQIRNGIVSIRSRFFLFYAGRMSGNSELMIDCECTDSVWPFDAPATQNQGGDVLIGTSATAIGFHQQILIPPDDGITVFWIEISETASGITPVLYGIFSASDFPLPSSGWGITPLGYVETFGGAETIFQLQSGNLINRYGPENVSSGLYSGATYYRGHWQNDNLSGEVFYPGDIVTAVFNSPPFNIAFYIWNAPATASLGVPGAAVAWKFLMAGRS